jgi:hypothetical protein
MKLRLGIYCLVNLLMTVPLMATDRPEWVIPSQYRIRIEVEPSRSAGDHAPVGAALDFAQIFRKHSIPGRLDRNSIRVVRFDPKSGRAIPYRKDREGYEVPYQFIGDFANTDSGRVAWRIADSSATHYHIYFDSLANGRRGAPSTRGLVGLGDSFHYNDGKPGPANVFPLHSTYWHLDWDGDQKRDLIGIAYRYYEYAVPTENNLGNAVYFLKNLGTTEQPLYAPPYRMKAEDGKYLRADQLPQDMFPVDWDGDGDIDFYGFDSDRLLLWENTGKRDRNNLLVLRQPREIMRLQTSDFRESLPGVIEKPRPIYRGARMVDWEGDGDLDLVAALYWVNIVKNTDPRKGIIQWGASLVFFELFENLRPDRKGNPNFAKPVVIRESRGVPVTAFTTAPGGPEYLDWDSDGDLDLIFFDATNIPLEGGRLMLAENDGTRDKPLLLKPMPILEVQGSPQVVDWSGDGCFDLIAGNEYFENINRKSGGCGPKVEARRVSGTRQPHPRSFPRFVSRGLASQVHPQILNYFTVSVDWDGDGMLDLLGGYQSYILYFRNKGTLLDPVFEAPVKIMAGGKPIYMPNWIDPEAEHPVHWAPQGPGEPLSGWVNPSIIDWDGDGDLDLFATGQRWQTLYYENVGTRTRPELAGGREVRSNGDPHEFSWRSRVSLGDLDGDGKVELVVTSNRENVFFSYEPKEQQSDPSILDLRRDRAHVLEDGSPLQGSYINANNNGDNHSLLIDWDGDGDLDLFNGSLYGLWYYENTGTRTSPKFKAHGQIKAGGEVLRTFNHAGSFDVADWNGDGRLDLIMGTECPSDQPIGCFLHLFDRSFIENALPLAQMGPVEKR